MWFGFPKMLHGVEHRADRVRVRHLAGHLCLPLAQEIRSTLLIRIRFIHHTSLNACQTCLTDVRSKEQ
jgi:hypothetical protein